MAPENTVLICGDFNAPHKDLGFGRATVKGKDLLDDAADAGFLLLTDPANPTRLGTAAARDTNPDLTFVRTASRAKRGVKWRNVGWNMGSDHYIIEVILSVPSVAEPLRKHRITDWDRFRQVLEGQPEQGEEITDIGEWADAIVLAAENATTEVETDETIQQVDNRLAHMLEARQLLQRRWKTQRTNRRLCKKVALLNQAIEKYS